MLFIKCSSALQNVSMPSVGVSVANNELMQHLYNQLDSWSLSSLPNSYFQKKCKHHNFVWYPFFPRNVHQLKKFLEGAQRPRNPHPLDDVCINIGASILCSRSEIKYHTLLPNLSYYCLECSPRSINRNYLIYISFPFVYITNCS